MGDIFPSTKSANGDGPQGGNFSAAGRTVASGRGWDWIAEGFALFRRQPGMWILSALILGLISFGVGIIPVLGSVGNILLLPILEAGLMLGCRAQEQGGELALEHLFAGFKKNTGNLVMVGVFNFVGLVAIGLATMAAVGGSVLMALMHGNIEHAGISIAAALIAALLIAGLSVPLCMATWFAPALIVLHDLAPVEALKASFYGCLRNWLPFLVYGVLLFVLGVAAAIPAGLGYLVLIPVIIASAYTSFRDIFRSE